MEPLTEAVEVLSTTTAVTQQPLVAVSTPSGALVAWSDDTWGATEIVVRAVDFGACP